MPEYPLTRFGLMAKRHWKIYLPTLYRELEKEGTLEEALYEAQENTKELLGDLIRAGMTYEEAWEVAREEYLLRPAEPGYQKHLNLDEWGEDEII